MTAEVAPLIAPASSALNPKITSEPAASDPAATLPAKRAEDSSSQATPAPGDEANQSAVDVVLQLTPQVCNILLHLLQNNHIY